MSNEEKIIKLLEAQNQILNALLNCHGVKIGDSGEVEMTDSALAAQKRISKMTASVVDSFRDYGLRRLS